MAKRAPRDLAWDHLKKAIPDDIFLEVLRLIVTRLFERCDDPVRLKQIYDSFSLPYDEKFAQAVRKAEAQDALKKVLQVIDGGKKAT